MTTVEIRNRRELAVLGRAAGWGAMVGALTGGVVGSFLFYVVGTVFGAAVGGVVGSIFGLGNGAVLVAMVAFRAPPLVVVVVCGVLTACAADLIGPGWPLDGPWRVVFDVFCGVVAAGLGPEVLARCGFPRERSATH